MNNNNWLKTQFPPEMLDSIPVQIKTRIGIITKGVLTVEKSNLNTSEIIVSASFNSSPFQNTVTQEVFFLTQKQLDLFCDKGADAVLDAPQKGQNTLEES